MNCISMPMQYCISDAQINKPARKRTLSNKSVYYQPNTITATMQFFTQEQQREFENFFDCILEHGHKEFIYEWNYDEENPKAYIVTLDKKIEKEFKNGFVGYGKMPITLYIHGEVETIKHDGKCVVDTDGKEIKAIRRYK